MIVTIINLEGLYVPAMQQTYTSISIPVQLRDQILRGKKELEQRIGYKVTTVEYLRRVVKDWQEQAEDGTSGICIGVSDDPAMAGGVIA